MSYLSEPILEKIDEHGISIPQRILYSGQSSILKESREGFLHNLSLDEEKIEFLKKLDIETYSITPEYPGVFFELEVIKGEHVQFSDKDVNLMFNIRRLCTNKSILEIETLFNSKEVDALVKTGSKLFIEAYKSLVKSVHIYFSCIEEDVNNYTVDMTPDQFIKIDNKLVCIDPIYNGYIN